MLDAENATDHAMNFAFTAHHLYTYWVDEDLYGKKFFTDDTYGEQNLFQRSDNYWLAKIGIPSHTILASSPNDEYYHSPADEAPTLDFPLMARIIKAIAISSTGLVDGTDTPSRINPKRID